MNILLGYLSRVGSAKSFLLNCAQERWLMLLLHTVSVSETIQKKRRKYHLYLLRWFSEAARPLETCTPPPHSHLCSLASRIPRGLADSRSNRTGRTSPIPRSRTVGPGEALAYSLLRLGNSRRYTGGDRRSREDNMHEMGYPFYRTLSPLRDRSHFGEERSQMPLSNNI